MRLINIFKRNVLQIKELRGIPDFKTRYIFSPDIYVKNKSLFVQIKSKHLEYIKTVSSPQMAMSLELANFTLAYCLSYKPVKILDLGSGFSSFVFRLYKQNSTDKNVSVYSVDDNDVWLDKTKNYLQNNNLSIENLFNLIDLKKQDLNNFFDFVLLDLNFVEIRKDYIKYSADIINSKGIVIIDDVHKVEFLKAIKKIAASDNNKLFNIRKNTQDSFGRFAIALKK